MLTDREFSANCYLGPFTVSISGLLYSHGAVTGFPKPEFHFSIEIKRLKNLFASCNLEL